MSPRLVVRTFGPGREQIWERLTNVLAYTARRHLVGWRIDIASIVPSEAELASPRGVQGYVWNTHKLEEWTRVVHEAPDGEEILLLDADTVILRPLDDVWMHAFDVAYTVKPDTASLPLNGGVIFVRATPAAREFMALWRAKNRLFLDNPLEFDVWRNFGGLNQAALGAVLRQKQHRAVIKKLPCLEWNCEDEHWASFDARVTRILHCKSHLQRAIFRMAKPEDAERPLMERWRSLEAEYMDEAGRRPSTPIGPDRDMQITADEITTPECAPARPTLTRSQRRRQKHQQPA